MKSGVSLEVLGNIHFIVLRNDLHVPGLVLAMFFSEIIKLRLISEKIHLSCLYAFIIIGLKILMWIKFFKIF